MLLGAAPGLAASGRLASVGPARGDQELHLILSLRGDDAGLEAFASAVSTPGSALYGHYASAAILARRFGAPPATRRAVVSYLRSQGARDVSADATGLLVHATMSVSVAERLFEVPLARYRVAGAPSFVAPSARVQIPADLRGSVDGVIGLDSRPLKHRPGLRTRRPGGRAGAHTAGQPTSAMSLSGTPRGCGAARQTGGFMPNQYEAAYGFDPLYAAGLKGQGQRVALVETDGVSSSDLKSFGRCIGIGRLRLKTYLRGGLRHSLAPGSETTLDVEILGAVAPRLRQIEVFEIPDTDQGYLDAFAATLNTPGAKPGVISLSIGICEQVYPESGDLGAVRAQNRLFSMLAASGITFLASSGDNGSSDCTKGDIANPNVLAVDFPASSPWATGVGGTNFRLSPRNQILSQLVWNDTTVDRGSAGGGGLSKLFGRPRWQRGVVGQNHRGVPDVSMLADPYPGYAYYCSASDCDRSAPWNVSGGTSASAPLLAGGIALVDEALARRSRELVGFANPLLYYLGSSPAAGRAFDDVTAYSNDVGPYIGAHRAFGCCNAGAGFDLASGWGSVNIAGLAGLAESMLPVVPRISLSLSPHQRPVHAHGVAGSISCSRACRVGAVLSVSIAGGRGFRVRTPLYSLSSSGRRAIAVRFSRGQERALRAALSRHRRISALAYAYAVDSSGARTEETARQELSITG